MTRYRPTFEELFLAHLEDMADADLEAAMYVEGLRSQQLDQALMPLAVARAATDAIEAMEHAGYIFAMSRVGGLVGLSVDWPATMDSFACIGVRTTINEA